MVSICALERNKPFYFWIVALLFLELLSFLAWAYTPLAIIFLFVLGLALIWCYRHDRQYLIFLPLVELFWGGMGRSIQYDFFSLRWLVFIVTIGFFLLSNIKNLPSLKIVKNKTPRYLFLAYFSLLAFLIILAAINHHPWRNIFLDANAYFYFLYLPIWLEYYETQTFKKLVKILLASSLILAIKTIITFCIFTQSNFELITYYKWIRDTRTGEITKLDNGFFRIFFQAQIYLLVAWFITFDQAIKNHLDKRKFFYLLILSSALYISLSRSLWLGLLLGIIVLFIFNKAKLQAIKYLFLLGIASYALVVLLFNFPHYHQWNLFNNRSVDSQEAALATRTILLPVMLDSISREPVIGYGFGKELTFFSQDPRSKNASNPTGERTTFSFEWGWLDFMLKGGLLLAIFFVYSLFYIIKGTYAIIKLEPVFTPYLAIFSSLALIHVFTPYLNHPLGLGLLVLGIINIQSHV